MLSSPHHPRNKNDPSDGPILSSLSILFCYHQGTVVKGSFLITMVRIPRTILMYVYNTLKDKVRQHLTTKLITGKLQQVPGQKNVTWDSGYSEGSSVLQVPSPTPPHPSQTFCPVSFVYGFMCLLFHPEGSEGGEGAVLS